MYILEWILQNESKTFCFTFFCPVKQAHYHLQFVTEHISISCEVRLSCGYNKVTHGVTANRDDTDFHHAKPQIL